MKNKLASRLPIQQMIANVLSSATEKLAEDQAAKERKVKNLLAYEKKEHGHIPTPYEEEHEEKEEMEEHREKKAAVSPVYIDKLASAVESIVANFDSIEFPQKGLLQKAAEESAHAGSPQGSGKGPGALEVSQAIGGEQNHNMGHAHNIEASSSKMQTPLSPSHEGDGSTQLHNNMHHAPGGGSLTPTGKYPPKGPLVSGPSVKHAGALDSAAGFARKTIGNTPTLAGAAIGAVEGGRSDPDHRFSGAAKGALVGGALGAGVHHAGRLANHTGNVAADFVAKNKTASDVIRQAVLRKLAGEDVMKANIEAERSANPLAGMGQLESYEASQAAPHQSGDAIGAVCGNQARRLISSNESAINATKRDAKGPVKTELSQVLDEPALNAGTDTVLKNNLQNTGKAGVKIAAARAALEKVAQQGCTCETVERECAFCRVSTKVAAATQQRRGSTEKIAHDMMGGIGGGMSAGNSTSSMSPTMTGANGGVATAEAGAGADGCTCGGTGECRICKLKAALAAAAKAGGTGPGMTGPTGPSLETGSPGAAPVGTY